MKLGRRLSEEAFESKRRYALDKLEKLGDAPGPLSWVLALTPLPVAGEIAAWRIVNHDSKKTSLEDMASMGISASNYYTSAQNKFIAFRAAAYFLIPSLAVLGHYIIDSFSR